VSDVSLQIITSSKSRSNERADFTSVKIIIRKINTLFLLKKCVHHKVINISWALQRTWLFN